MKRILRSVTCKSVLMLLAILVSSASLFSQTRTITGVVKSSTEVLPGVSILEKGTNNGTVTDSDGKFTIAVSENALLIFSFVGMKSQEVSVGNQTDVEVTLDPEVTELGEVVVIGYGTAKKSDLTGSVASVSGADLKKVPVASVAESLSGRLAGVQVSGTEGSPDAEIKIRVRGGGSITQDNAPLYIVDGFPVNTISDITPSDIQSIDVLKDASSTAIYGSRGANGVIIITTKSGKEGKLTVSYNAFMGPKRIANTLDVLSPGDYAKWQYEYAVLENDLPSFENYFGSYQDLDLYKGLKGNNYQEQIYGRTGQVFSNDLSLRGGSDKFSYSVNYALYDEKAIMLGSDFNRNNITLKLNNKPNDKVDLAFSVRYSHTEINGAGTNEQNERSSSDSRLKNTVIYAPIPIPGISSNDTGDDLNSLINPFVLTTDNDRYQERKNFNMAGSFGWTIIENLQVKTEFGLDNNGFDDNRYYGPSTYYVNNSPAAINQGKPAVIFRDRTEVRFRNTNTINYDFKKFLPSDHNLKLLVGEETIKTETNQVTSVIHGFPSTFTADDAFKLSSQGDPQSVDNFYSPDDKLLSFFTRANYDFKGRYLLSATFRADGSSKFLGDNRWGYFPSAAAAWKVSEESFMGGTKNWLSSLKMRMSYGVAGNNNIPTGQTFQAFVSGTTTWMNGFDKFWAASSYMANPNLKWESTQTRNIGLDFGVLENRLTGSLEAYLNNTEDLLIEFPVSGTGYTSQFRNLGETENKGIEASMNYIAIDKKDYGVSFSFNISFNRNKVVSIGTMKNLGWNTNWASTEIGIDYLVRPGGPVGSMYGYKNGGRYEVSDFEGYNSGTGTWTLNAGVDSTSVNIIGPLAPGKMKLKDVNGDGIINGSDQTIIGNANPKHTGGFIINGYAFGFDLTAAFSWSYGNDVYNANKIEYTTTTSNGQYRNMITMMEDGKRWNNIDPATGIRVTDPTELAALNENTTMWSPYMKANVFSDWAVEDGSFLRLNTLTLGYSLPASITSKIHIQSLRFYATGYNLFVITGYSGFDPEASTRRNTTLTPGVDYAAYPRSKQIVFGLNLSF